MWPKLGIIFKGWLQLTFAWVVPLPSPHQLGLDSDQGIFRGVYLLCGHFCYWVMKDHFKKHILITMDEP